MDDKRKEDSEAFMKGWEAAAAGMGKIGYLRCSGTVRKENP
jgi:hypothetical protein